MNKGPRKSSGDDPTKPASEPVDPLAKVAELAEQLSDSIRQILDQASALMIQGRYDEALNLLESLEFGIRRHPIVLSKIKEAQAKVLKDAEFTGVDRPTVVRDPSGGLIDECQPTGLVDPFTISWAGSTVGTQPESDDFDGPTTVRHPHQALLAHGDDGELEGPTAVRDPSDFSRAGGPPDDLEVPAAGSSKPEQQKLTHPSEPPGIALPGAAESPEASQSDSAAPLVPGSLLAKRLKALSSRIGRATGPQEAVSDKPAEAAALAQSASPPPPAAQPAAASPPAGQSAVSPAPAPSGAPVSASPSEAIEIDLEEPSKAPRPSPAKSPAPPVPRSAKEASKKQALEKEQAETKKSEKKESEGPEAKDAEAQAEAAASAREETEPETDASAVGESAPGEAAGLQTESTKAPYPHIVTSDIPTLDLPKVRVREPGALQKTIVRWTGQRKQVLIASAAGLGAVVLLLIIIAGLSDSSRKTRKKKTTASERPTPEGERSARTTGPAAAQPPDGGVVAGAEPTAAPPDGGASGRSGPVRVKLAIGPEAARPVVTFRDKVYRGRTFESPPVQPGTDYETVIVSAEGYRTVKLQLKITSDVTRNLVLEPDPGARPPDEARPDRPRPDEPRAARVRPAPSRPAAVALRRPAERKRLGKRTRTARARRRPARARKKPARARARPAARKKSKLFQLD